MSNIDYQSLPDSALVRQRNLLPVLPFAAATLWRRVKSGEFPKPIKIDGSITAWRWGDVRTWLDAQAQAVRS